MKKEPSLKQKCQYWEKVYTRIGHVLVALGFLSATWGIWLMTRGNMRQGTLFFFLAPLFLIASTFFFYVFTEPTDLKNYLGLYMMSVIVPFENRHRFTAFT